MDYRDLPTLSKHNNSANILREAFKSIQQVKINHMYNGKKEIKSTDQVISLRDCFLYFAHYLDNLCIEKDRVMQDFDVENRKIFKKEVVKEIEQPVEQPVKKGKKNESN